MPESLMEPQRRSDVEALCREIQGLRDAEQARALFLRAAVHELRGPLMSILIQLQMAMGADLAPSVRDGLKVALRNAERLEMLTTDLANVGGIEALGFNIKVGTVDLQEVAQEVAASLKVPAAVKGIDMQLDVEGPVPVPGDRQRLVQVASNLLNNAIRFTPRGGTVRFAAWSEAEHACFSVTDSGPGIPADQRANLFQPFQQLHEAAVDGGSGLGLFICRNIVAAHGGRIEASSGPGATFTVRLPRASPRFDGGPRGPDL